VLWNREASEGGARNVKRRDTEDEERDRESAYSGHLDANATCHRAYGHILDSEEPGNLWIAHVGIFRIARRIE
jgi:hypothetical protein